MVLELQTPNLSTQVEELKSRLTKAENSSEALGTTTVAKRNSLLTNGAQTSQPASPQTPLNCSDQKVDNTGTGIRDSLPNTGVMVGLLLCPWLIML